MSVSWILSTINSILISRDGLNEIRKDDLTVHIEDANFGNMFGKRINGFP